MGGLCRDLCRPSSLGTWASRPRSLLARLVTTPGCHVTAHYGIDHLSLRKIGKKHGKTPAQVMLRWTVEQGAVPLPKSVHPYRIKENFEIFDFKLDKEDLKDLSKLEQDYRTCWDPTHVA